MNCVPSVGQRLAATVIQDTSTTEFLYQFRDPRNMLHDRVPGELARLVHLAVGGLKFGIHDYFFSVRPQAASKARRVGP